jgi:lysophospholipase L1-like esterase
MFVAALYMYGVIGTRSALPQAQLIMPTFGPSDRHRVAIFGTSLTNRGNWVARLEARLKTCNPLLTIEAISRPGASSRWGIDRVAKALDAAEAPYDIVIFEFSGNDASLMNGFPLFISRRLHREMIAMVRASDAIVFMATMNPAWGRDAWERPGQNRYHALYRDLANTLDIGLIDTITDWRSLSNDMRITLVPDGLHPTDAGMAMITIPAFEAALRPIVCANHT